MEGPGTFKVEVKLAVNYFVSQISIKKSASQCCCVLAGGGSSQGFPAVCVLWFLCTLKVMYSCLKIRLGAHV